MSNFTNDEPSIDIQSWDDLDIPNELLRGIYAYGFEKPSPIQSKSIKTLINGKDIIAQAQSGTGKTAAFTIGALTRLNLTESTTQILIMSPTHELSRQNLAVLTGIGSMLQGMRTKLLVGGSSADEDILSLKKDIPHVIAGCPGRVVDMIRRKVINTNTIKMIILDEADEMLSSDFKDQMYSIFEGLKKDVQIALFSATLPPDIRHIATKIMRNPVEIFVKTEQLTLDGISQYYVAVDDDQQKYSTLKDLFSIISMTQSVIYCNSVKRVADLYDAMIEDGFPVCCIHSGMDKGDRDRAFSDFKTGKFRVLISSNVTARGIDIQQISAVINFDIPKCVHTYIHRIGRSGRWGRKGVGINFITRRDDSKRKEIEQFYATQINELPNDFGNELGNKI